MFPCRHKSTAERLRMAFAAVSVVDLSAVARHPATGRVRRLHTIRATIVATAPGWGRIVRDGQFVYHPSMVAEPPVEIGAAGIAAAIGEPARARMLYCLLDGHARTSTELAIIGEVSPSTASVHLARLKEQRLVKVLSQGKHRYYSLHGESVARALEALMVVAGGTPQKFGPATPPHLRPARTCYDHMAGHLAVSLRDRFEKLNWLVVGNVSNDGYDLTEKGAKAFAALGIDIDAVRSLRRRFAYACVDWSERRPHIGGALGGAILQIALKQEWFVQNLDSRALSVTALGRRQLQARFGLQL
jgi:DNA-binding transcriptional ArsR family regulator